MELMVHTGGVVFLLSILNILDIPLEVCGSQYGFLLLVRRRESKFPSRLQEKNSELACHSSLQRTTAELS